MAPAKVLAALSVVCVSLLGSHGSATAQWLSVDHCETVQVSGASFVRIGFSVRDLAIDEQITHIRMFVPHHPVPTDTCHAIQASAPAGWNVTFPSDGGVFYAEPSGIGIPSGQVQSGFQITMSKAECCFLFAFSSFLDPFGGEDVCFACATPTRVQTWGRLKTSYR